MHLEIQLRFTRICWKGILLSLLKIRLFLHSVAMLENKKNIVFECLLFYVDIFYHFYIYTNWLLFVVVVGWSWRKTFIYLKSGMHAVLGKFVFPCRTSSLYRLCLWRISSRIRGWFFIPLPDGLLDGQWSPIPQYLHPKSRKMS